MQSYVESPEVITESLSERNSFNAFRKQEIASDRIGRSCPEGLSKIDVKLQAIPEKRLKHRRTAFLSFSGRRGA